MNILDGKKLAVEIAAKLKAEVDELHHSGIAPKLVILAVEPDERSQAYIKAKVTCAKNIGIKTEVVLKSNESIEYIKTTLTEIAREETVHGIIIQLPLPSRFNAQELIDLIPPEKDVDGLTTTNAKRLAGNKALFAPATPLAVIEILKRKNAPLNSSTIAVIGQGKLVGKPLSKMLKHYDTNILVADRTTKDITIFTQKADIIVSACGQPKLLKANMIKTGAIVIDVGISKVDGKITGDVDFDNVAKKAGLITPVIGGVGPMTVVMLMSNVIMSTKRS